MICRPPEIFLMHQWRQKRMSSVKVMENPELVSPGGHLKVMVRADFFLEVIEKVNKISGRVPERKYRRRVHYLGFNMGSRIIGIETMNIIFLQLELITQTPVGLEVEPHSFILITEWKKIEREALWSLMFRLNLMHW